MKVLFLILLAQLKAYEEQGSDAILPVVMIDENGNETEYQLYEGEPSTAFMEKEGSITRE